MKTVRYKILNDSSKELNSHLKNAGVGVAIDHTEEDGTVVNLYLLDGTDFTPELILQLGVIIGTINTFHKLRL